MPYSGIRLKKIRYFFKFLSRLTFLSSANFLTNGTEMSATLVRHHREPLFVGILFAVALQACLRHTSFLAPGTK